MRYTWDIFSTGTSYVGTPRILGRNYSNLRSALRISIFFSWRHLQGGGTVGVSSDSALAWLGRLRGGWLMVSLLSLFYFLNLVPCLRYRFFTDVKASLFTLIVIDFASEDDCFLWNRGVYCIVFRRCNITIILVTICPTLRIFRHCGDFRRKSLQIGLSNLKHYPWNKYNI